MPHVPGYELREIRSETSGFVVYGARSVSDGRIVSIKLVPEHSATDAFVALKRDHDVRSGLDLDCVVKTLALLRHGGHVALVTEYFRGVSLARLCADGRPDLLQALEIASGAASALKEIHGAGLIHNAVNPDAFLYGTDCGQVKLVNFTACIRKGEARIARLGSSVAALQYIAPEQSGRMNRSVDARSDLYSLGVTLYELLTGRPPFARNDALELVHAHLAVTPRAPREVDPAVPGIVSRIVERLVSKSPDDRYQTAAGLAADLEACLDRYRNTGVVEPFELGCHDVSPHFEPLRKLVGRHAETERLLEAYGRVARGAVETVLITGATGVGRSSIGRDLGTRVALEHGRFASGRFERSRLETPFSALADALEQLVQQLLTRPQEELGAWRRGILDAVEGNGQLVVDLVPSLELVIGAQQPPAPVPATEANNRYRRTLVSFVKVLCEGQSPLVLFLDDLQWADQASLSLIGSIVGSPGTVSLLFVGAYCNDDAEAGDGLAALRRELKAKRVRFDAIELSPLSLESTQQLVSESLHRRLVDADDLASVVWNKTGGNPFFINQFLKTLFDRELIRLDTEAGTFHVDRAGVDGLHSTDNMAGVLINSYAQLPEKTQEALRVAAAIGSRFDLATLADVLGDDQVATSGLLDEAMRRSFVVTQSELGALRPGELDSPLGYSRFAFQHDRVQQFAYELTDEAERPALHLRIGRILRDRCETEGEDRIFHVVHHLNLGAGLIDTEAERNSLIELNVDASKRARLSTSYELASRLLRTAIELLGAGDDTFDNSMCDLHVWLVECLTLSGRYGEALEVVQAALDRTTSSADRMRLLTAEIGTLTVQGDMIRAVEHGLDVLESQGVVVPEDSAELSARLEAELGKIIAAIDARGAGSFLELPEMRDPERIALMTLLMHLLPATYQADPRKFSLICSKLVTLSLEYGNCRVSAKGYGSLAAVLSGVLGRYEDAYALAKVGVDLTYRFDDPSLRSGAYFVWGMLASPWTQPLQESLDLYAQAVDLGLKYGDHSHASYATTQRTLHLAFMSASVERFLLSAEDSRELLEELDDNLNPAMLAPVTQLHRWLRGEVHGDTLSDDEFDEDAAADRARQSRNKSLLTHVCVTSLMHRYLNRDYAAALRFAAEGRDAHAGSNAVLAGTLLAFYHSLSVAALYRTASESEQREYRAVLESNQAKLREWARHCPENFEQHALLVEAEQARIGGQPFEALDLYDRAIAAAAAHGFRGIEGLACELCAEFWAALGKDVIAVSYTARARAAYAAWGAVHKIEQLSGASTRGPGIDEDAAKSLDVAAVIKASRAMAGEIVMERLLGILMNIVLETAGADTGTLVLGSGGELLVQAQKARGDSEPAVMTAIPLAQADHVAAGIVNYVCRTRETVVLDDARDSDFKTDAYVLGAQAKSVLCAPIVHQGKLVGALYVENDLTTGAFTPDRVEALDILMSQIAISIQNATLFSIQDEQTRELERYRDHLEELVKERTRELESAHQSLLAESEEKERMQQELRLAQKLEAVGQLAAGIAHEINTPVQFVGDNLTFLSDAWTDACQVLDLYRDLAAAVDKQAHGKALAEIEAAEDDIDLEQLCREVPQAFGEALDGTKRIAKIVGSMKQFAHPGGEQKSEQNVKEIIENTLTVTQNEYKYVADVETHFGPVPNVPCHPGDIGQLLLNLIVNAAHAIGDAIGENERGTIRIETTLEDTRTLLVKIGDTGPGIPNDVAERVFDPFFTTKQVGKGTGQGLAIARTIAERHDGSLTFDSKAGQGTTFYLRLPLEPPAALTQEAV